MNESELTKLFRRLGAPNAAAWAHSRINGHIPQLARFLFLRQAWKLIVGDNDTRWISERMGDKASDPGGAIAPALKRLLAAGATESDLAIVVRVMQWRLLFGLSLLLDDPGNLENEVKDVAWRLFRIDAQGRPIEPVTGLHESVLETDPTGREMRPR